MENLSNNQNLSSDRKQIKTWEEIPKVKWDGLPKKEDVNQLINQNQTLIKSKPIIVIEAIQKRIANQIENNKEITPITNIFDVLCHPDTLRVAYARIKGNKGALTPGTDPTTTADTFAEKQIQELSLKLKNGTFKWKPVRRIMVEKPGKKEKRPLGLPDFDDKVVQGAILLLLEAGFEAEFEKLDCNFGFRPNKDPNTAMEKINMEAKSFQFGVEGDIKGAYDNVKHKKLIQILGKRFTDQKFLHLIQTGLESGYMLEFQTYQTLLGTPQGSICSPILFNIYMQEFDKYVLFELLNKLNPNPQHTTRSSETNPEYEKFRSRRRIATSQYNEFQQTQRDFNKMLLYRFCEYFKRSPYVNQVLIQNPQIKEALEEVKKIDRYIRGKPRVTGENFKTSILNNTTEEKQEILKKEYEEHLKSTAYENWKIQKTTQYKNPEQLEKKITYVRYADDWIIFVRGTKEDAEKVKDLAAQLLQNELGLTLSLEKTKITDLYTKNANFLGFEIYYQRNKKNKKVEKGQGAQITPVTQRMGVMQFNPDRERITNRFIQKKYMLKDGTPREVGFLTILQDHEIITKYNQFMLGIGNYYIRQISIPSSLNRYFYILYYSCIKTLATKHRLTVKGVIKKYGYMDLSNPNLNKLKPNANDLRIVASYNFNNQKKYAVLYNYQELMCKLKKIKNKYIGEKLEKKTHEVVREIDMLTLHKVNFRTAFKETSFCAICGKQEKSLHNHHIKPLKWKKNPNQKGYKGFDQVVAALGRKQIPVCSECHHKIHAGKYNGIELNELYDIRLVAPEGLIKLTNQQPINPSPVPQNSGKAHHKGENITINEDKKTYFNRELNEYFIRKQIKEDNYE